MSPVHFQLCANFICMPITVSDFFQKKSSILSIIICNPQFYHTYVRWKSSVLPENIYTSFFNYILIIFGCLSLYLRFWKKIFNFISYPMIQQFYHTHVRWKSSVHYKNVSSSFFNNTLVVFFCLSLYLSFCFSKYLQFYKLCYPQF